MRWLKPWSASSGAQKSASARPATSSTAAAAASRTARLFGNDILKARPRKNRKYQVVESEEAEVAPGGVDDSRAHPADDHGNDEREEEERQQKLARTPHGRHRGEEGADRREPEVRKQDRDHELPPDRLEEERGGGERALAGGAEGDEDA